MIFSPVNCACSCFQFMQHLFFLSFFLLFFNEFLSTKHIYVVLDIVVVSQHLSLVMRGPITVYLYFVCLNVNPKYDLNYNRIGSILCISVKIKKKKCQSSKETYTKAGESIRISGELKYAVQNFFLLYFLVVVKTKHTYSESEKKNCILDEQYTEASDKIPSRFIGCWFDDPKCDEQTAVGSAQVGNQQCRKS